jgi:hypothetical protein
MESMASSSVNGEPGTDPVAEPSVAELLEQLQADRLWLLQQIDGGRWPDLRLDLAALERELGQLLEQAQERAQKGISSSPSGRSGTSGEAFQVGG